MAVLTAKLDKEVKLKNLLLKIAIESRKEEGCLTYHVCQDKKNPLIFGLYEEWKSQEIHQKQFEKPYVKEFFEVSDEIIEASYSGLRGYEISPPRLQNTCLD